MHLYRKHSVDTVLYCLVVLHPSSLMVTKGCAMYARFGVVLDWSFLYFFCTIFQTDLESPIPRRRRTSFANVYSKSVDSVLSLDVPSMCVARPKPSDPPPPVEITKESSQPPTTEVLDLHHFWLYHCLRHIQAHLPVLSTVTTIFLLFLVILQLLFSMLVFAFSVYHTANKHSCISSEKWFFMFVTVFLYFFTRGLLPLITVWAFSSAVVKNLGIQSSSLASEFLEAISRKENESVLQAVVRTFWDVGLAKKTYSTILQTLTQHFAKELGVMCITSTLEAAIITTMLIQVGATRFALDAYSIPFGGVLEVVIESLDALSYFALILTIGIICSFFNHEATMNRLVAGAVALEDHADTFGVEPSKELIQSAKNTVNNFNNSWNISEIFLFLSVQVYTLILVFFVGAGLPLSCGITAHMHTEQIHLYWFPFVIVFSVGHFLSTCVWPSAHGASKYRVIGILLEGFLLVVLYIIQPPLFGSFLQILFAVMPAAYLFWYLWMKVHYENSVRSAKPKGWRQPHERNMRIYICLMVQLVSAIVLSIISEYFIIRVNSAV